MPKRRTGDSPRASRGDGAGSELFAVQADGIFGEFAGGFPGRGGEAGGDKQLREADLVGGGVEETFGCKGDGDDRHVFGDATLLELFGPVLGGCVGFLEGVEGGDNEVGEVFLGLHGVQGSGADLGLHVFDLGEGEIGEEGVEAPHQVVGNAHDLAVHLGGGLVDADGVAVGLRHLLDAVEAFEDGDHQDTLLGLAEVLLQVAAAHEVELLVGSAEFDVAGEGDGIVALGDGGR